MEAEIERLLSYRVKSDVNRNYRAKEMGPEEIRRRRYHFRKFLKGHPHWENLPDADLDNMILLTGGKGRYLLQDTDGYEFAILDTSVTAEEAAFRKARAMMPFQFINLMGKDFDWAKYSTDVEEPKGIVNKYILNYPAFRERGMGLYIYSGTKGSGKTMLACCILNEIAKRYQGSVKFTNTLDFLELTKKGYDGDPREVDSLYQAGLLVVDDLGVQMNREWIDTVFYRLVNERYVNKRPTIYTSNITIDKLKMDERITDRIESMTYAVNLPEKSVRREELEKEKERILNEIGKALT